MLPRWLTALPRFAATWRDEIVVVAVGLAYTAGLCGPLAPGRTMHDAADGVVVRIAAPVAVAVSTTVEAKRYPAPLAPTTVEGTRLRVTRVAPLPGSHRAVATEPAMAIAGAVNVASMGGARAFVVDGAPALK